MKFPQSLSCPFFLSGHALKCSKYKNIIWKLYAVTILFLTHSALLVQFLILCNVRVTKCHNLNLEAIYLCRNWLITDTTNDSSNPGDNDPTVNSTCKIEAVLYHWHWRCPSFYRIGAVCILQKGKLVFSLMIKHTLWNGQRPKNIFMWYIAVYVLKTPYAVCYCKITM
jgi:hypothetical protein